jgi:hypothetical protein
MPSQRIIHLQDHSLISLSPQFFRKMLKLPETTLTFKGDYVGMFLDRGRVSVFVIDGVCLSLMVKINMISSIEIMERSTM